MLKLSLTILGLLIAVEASRHRATKFKEYHCSDVSEDFDADLKAFLQCHYSGYVKDRYHDERLKRFKACRDRMMSHMPDEVGFAVGFTRFCWMTVAEYNKTLNHKLNKPRDHAYERDAVNKEADLKVRQALPASVNWVTGGRVTAVKDQGNCGSCYTFAAAASLEGQAPLFGYGLVNISEQQYVDCAQNYSTMFWNSPGYWSNHSSCTYTWSNAINNWLKSCTVQATWVPPTSSVQYVNQAASDPNGCDGGDPGSVYAYNILTAPQNGLSCYPYVSGNTDMGNPCTASASCSTNIWIKSVVSVTGITPMMTALANVGPLACCIDADVLDGYAGGIVDIPSYSTSYTINHAVTAVGYGVDPVSGSSYWLVKNSWGVGWGEVGYFRLISGVNMAGFETCGCVYPVL